jgi:hypothetical protein
MPTDVNLNFTGNFDVAKLELKTGEILIVRVDQFVDRQLYEAMTRGFKNFLKASGYPQIPVLILEKGLSVEVVDLNKIEIITCGHCEKEGVPSEWAFIKKGKKIRVCLFCENVMRDRADLIFDEPTKTINLWEEKDN